MDLEKFLVNAKVYAYASGGGWDEGFLEDGSKELGFEEGEFRYRDRYFGWDPFVGEEVVWHGDRIIWAMNYYGLVFDEVVPAAEVYAFLQQAMNQVHEDRPFRGPKSLKKDDFEYFDESQGTVDRFTGFEKIYYREREIHRLHYHGGRVKSK